MTTQEQEKMWSIDSKLVMGDKITEEEKVFYNQNLNRMREEMRDNYTHWNHHTDLLNQD